MNRIAAVLGLCALAAAAAWAVMLARADAAFREGTPEGVDRAMKLIPWNATYVSAGALQAEYDGRDADGQQRREQYDWCDED